MPATSNRGGGGLSRWAVAAPAGPSTQGVGGANRPRDQAMGSSGGQHANPLAGCPRAQRVGRRVVHGVRVAHLLRPLVSFRVLLEHLQLAPWLLRAGVLPA
jgi:hypothetical protein